MKLFAKKSKRYLTFLFTDNNVKIAEVDSTGKRQKLFFEFALPEGLIVDGEVKNSEKLGQVLKQIETKIKHGNSFVVIGVSEEKASISVITLPSIEISEIDQAIKNQAESFLPFPYQSEYLDWMLLEKNDQGDKILLSAVSRPVIDGFITALRFTSYKPIAFETTSLSLYRLLPPQNRKSCFVVYVGDTSVVLVLGDKGNIEASSVIRESELLPSTLVRMKDYYSIGGESADGLKVYLTGRAISETVAVEIKSKLNAELIILKSEVQGLVPGRETELSLLFSLAQKEVASPEDEKSINVLPSGLAKEYRLTQEKQVEKNTLFLGIVLIIIFDLIIGFLIYKNVQEKSIVSAKIKSNIQLNDSDKNEIQLLKEKAETIKQLSSSNDVLISTVNDLISTPKEKIKIASYFVDYEKKELSLSGIADKRGDLLLFKDELEKKSYVDKVIIPLPSLTKEENTEFNLKILLK